MQTNIISNVITSLNEVTRRSKLVIVGFCKVVSFVIFFAMVSIGQEFSSCPIISQGEENSNFVVTQVSQRGVLMTTVGDSLMGGNNDKLSFYATQLNSTDVEIIAKVDGFLSEGSGLKFGLMFRESLDENSRFISFYFNEAGVVSCHFRLIAGEGIGGKNYSIKPYGFLRLSQSINRFSMSYSENGRDWIYIDGANLSLPSNSYAGTFLASGTDGSITDVEFSKIYLYSPKDVNGDGTNDFDQLSDDEFNFLNLGPNVYVSPTGSGSYTGFNWENALSQADLQMVLNADEVKNVYLLGGTYNLSETVRVPTGKNLIGSYVNMSGNYLRLLKDNSEMGSNIAVDKFKHGGVYAWEFSLPTIFDNGGANRLMISGDSAGLIDGIIFQNGTGRVSVLTTSQTYQNCIIRNMSCTQMGGAFFWGSTQTLNLINCLITNVSSNSAGGVIARDWWSTFNSTINLTNCAFIGNKSNSDGGVIGFRNFKVDAVNCLFANNQSAGVGAVMHNADHAERQRDVSFRNCTFANNKSLSNNGNIVSVGRLSTGRGFSNCLMYGNYATNAFAVNINWTGTNNAGDWNLPAGKGLNLVSNPFLVNYEFVGVPEVVNDAVTYTNWQAAANNPVIDGGSNVVGGFDLLGNARTIAGGTDIGVYENTRDLYSVQFYLGETLFHTSKVFSGDVVEMPVNPLHENGTFVGWYADDNFNAEFNSTNFINNNCEVYAKFSYPIYYFSVLGSGDKLGYNWENSAPQEKIQNILYTSDVSEIRLAGSVDGIEYTKSEGFVNSMSVFVIPAGKKISGGWDIVNNTRSANFFSILKKTTSDDRGVVYLNSGFSATNRTTIEGFIITGGASVGGGICAEDNTLVKDCEVYGNSARSGVYAGGIQLMGSNITIANCYVHDNGGSTWGAGISSQRTGCNNIKIINCIVVNNGETYWGFSGIANKGSTFDIINSVIANNGNGGIGSEAGGVNNVKNSIVYGNSGSAFVGNNNFENCYFENPYFANPTTDTSALYSRNGGLNNWALEASSPCINGGANVIDDLITSDIVGNIRCYEDAVDIGAFELQQNRPFFTITFKDVSGVEIYNLKKYTYEVMTEVHEPSKNGATFINWYDNQTLTTETVFPFTVNSDKDVYAKWIYSLSFITPAGSGSRTGENWENAFASESLQFLFDMAIVNEIKIASGLYIPVESINSITSFNIERSNLNISGSWDNSLNIQTNNPSILTRKNNDDVRILSITGNSVILDKLTISGANFSGGSGGGLFINGSDCVVDRCNILENRISQRAANGGGIYTQNIIHIKNSLIAGNINAGTNAWRNGGGAYVGSGSLIENCVIVNNEVSRTTDSFGGGLFFSTNTYSNSRVVNCTIAFNKSSNDTAIHQEGKVVNTLFYGNTGHETLTGTYEYNVSNNGLGGRTNSVITKNPFVSENIKAGYAGFSLENDFQLTNSMRGTANSMPERDFLGTDRLNPPVIGAFENQITDYQTGELKNSYFDTHEIMGNVERVVPEEMVTSILKYPTSLNHVSLTEDEKTAIMTENNSLINRTYILNEIANGTLKKHPAADGQFHGKVASDAQAVIKRIFVNPKMKGPRDLSLFIPGGELVTVKVPSDIVAKNFSFIIGYTNSLSDMGYVSGNRLPKLTCYFPLNESEIVLGTPFGGACYLDIGGYNGDGFEIEVSGAVPSPRYVYGQTTKEEWQKVREYPGLYSYFLTQHVQFHIPSKYSRDFEDPFEIMKLWDNCSRLSARLVYEEKREYPVIMNYDSYVAAGWACAWPGAWYCHIPDDAAPGTFDVNEIVKNGTWGIFHELNHHFQGHASPGGSWGFGYVGEVTNNFANVMSYITYTNIASYRTENGILGSGNASTDPYMTQQTFNSIVARCSDYADFGADGMYFYSMLPHSFGVEKSIELTRSYYDGSMPVRSFVDGHESRRDDFALRSSKIFKKNMIYFCDTLSKMKLGETVKTEIEALGYETFYPVSNVYTMGRDDVSTGRPFYISGGVPYDFKFVEKTLCPIGFTVAVSDAKYGSFEVLENGVYRYTPPADVTLIDEFSLTITLEDGQTTVLNGKICQEKGSLVKRWDDLTSTDIARSLVEIEGREPNAIYVNTSIAGIETTSRNGRSLLIAEGKIVAPVSGKYKIVLKADDFGQFFLKMNGSYVKICEINIYTNSYNLSDTNACTEVTLVAGQEYEYKMYNYNISGQLFGKVAWVLPDTTEVMEINARYLQTSDNLENPSSRLFVNKESIVPYVTPVVTYKKITGVSVISVPTLASAGGPAELVDGDTNSVFHTAWYGNIPPFPHDFVLDLGDKKDFNRIAISPRFSNQNGNVGTYEILIGDDLTNLVSLGEFINGQAVATAKFDLMKNARYVKISVKRNQSGNNFTVISEIELFCDFHTSKNISNESDFFDFNNDWETQSGSFGNGQIAVSTSDFSRLTFALQGKEICIYSAKGAEYGNMLISVNGAEFEEISLNSNNLVAQQLIFSRKFEDNGIKTFVIKPAIGSKINIDYISLDK